MISNNNIVSYIINLNKYKKNYDNQLDYFKSINLYPQRFNAINALDNNEYLLHKNLINKLAFQFTPRSIIGNGLSHILLCKYILNNYYNNTYSNIYHHHNNIYFLILEDDAYPLKKYINNSTLFYKDLNNEINNINILDKDWDIIQLHSDGPVDTKETYFSHYLSGSAAAYLISLNGLVKMSNECVSSYIDICTQNIIKYNKYRTKNNLFYTDESSSTNQRINNNYFFKLKVNILDYIFSKRGEKTWKHYLSFKAIKLPYLNKELTNNNIIDIIFGVFLLNKIKNKFKNKLLIN